MTRRVAIVGTAAAPIGRWAPRLNEDAEGFEQDVLGPLVLEALAEAKCTPSDVGTAIFTQPSPSTKQLGFATFMAARLGLKCTGSLSQVNELGITGGLAFDQAANDIALGRSDVALAAGIAYQTNAPLAMVMEHSLRAVGDVDFQAPFGLTPISWYAFDMARYMHETGVSREDIAHVAVKSRAMAQHNPIAQFTKDLTLEDVLSQQMIVSPLGLYEVPSVADGAIALVLMDADLARAKNLEYVTISGRGFAHDGNHQIGNTPHDITEFPAAKAASQTALGEAGIDLASLDLAEIYAPCTITEVLASEAIGFFARGKGAAAAVSGDTSLGGRIPINTSGGCLSRGHPPALTGLYGFIETRDQLLGRAGKRQVDGAARALHMSELGNYNAALAHIVEAPL